LPMTCRI